MMRKYFLIPCLLFAAQIVLGQGFASPPEFEKNEGLILKWNYNEAIDSTVAQVASLISADDKVWIVCDTVNITGMSALQAQLGLHGANFSNIAFMQGMAENPWLRDYGPVAGYYVNGDEYNRHFVDSQYGDSQTPSADFLPLQLASDFGFNYQAMPLNFEGGNLLLDGIGRGFVSDRVISQNPGKTKLEIIQILYTYLSLNEIIILPSISECGGGEWKELSRLAKFIDPETVLVAQFPENVSYYAQMENLADTLSKTYNDVGKLLKVVRLPVASLQNGSFSSSDTGEIRSYTSSLIFNNKILIPSYNSPSDAVALGVYQQLFDGYQISQIPSQVLSANHGSLGRLTVYIPQEKLFRMRHSKYVGPQPFENELWINTFIQTFDLIDSIQLFYRVHPSTTFEVMNTYGCCGGNSGYLSGYTISDTVSYFLKAYSGDYIQTLPNGAPEATFTFWFDVFAGLKPLDKGQKLRVFPNPASSYVMVDGDIGDFQFANYQILNLSGMVVSEGDLKGSPKIGLPENLASGVYILKIITSGKSWVSKLYLQR
jgi:agmatine deiminase